MVRERREREGETDGRWGGGVADLEGRSSTEAYTYQPFYPLLSLVYLTLNLKNRISCMPVAT
jgi:hypothetical protein